MVRIGHFASILMLLLVGPLLGQENQQRTPSLSWELGPTGSKASLRGLWAVDDNVVWASGSKATVLRSSDGGSSWESCGPADYPDLEFRSIYAWSSEKAIIASAGTPCVILKTDDAGKSWRKVFEHRDEAAFLDGMRFWEESGEAKRGIAFGDPVGDKQTLMVLETKDGGDSWTQIPGQMLPRVAGGEAGFAASNSAMIVGKEGRAWIGTGVAQSTRSRLYFRQGWGQRWGVTQVPIPSNATQGIFSLALGGKTGSRLVAVGGDYRPEVTSNGTASMCDDGGGWWQPAQAPPAAYRSAVVYLSGPANAGAGFWIATGPAGSDYSAAGNRWTTFSDRGFHTLAVGESRVFAAGADGRFAMLKLGK